MGKACIGFQMDDPEKAFAHMQFEIVRDYGDYAFGHNLHTWDDGKRMLARCRTCGGYILIQKSEYHSFSDNGSDGYYMDYFPVDGPDEAEEFNRRFDGFRMESAFPSRYLCRTNGRLHWSCNKQGGVIR